MFSDFGRPKVQLTIQVMMKALAFMSSVVFADQDPGKVGSVGSPIWPPPSPVLESVAAYQDQLHAKRPSMLVIPTWMFPLDLASTPQSLVPRSRSQVHSGVLWGAGSTTSPALFTKLSTTTESGFASVTHGETLYEGKLFVAGDVGVQRSSVKKTGKIETFSSTVTNQSDLPYGSLSTAARILPGLWFGVLREWRRSFQRTINEVTVSGRTGIGESGYRSDMATMKAALEYQTKWIHAGFELTLDSDERLPSRSYSIPMRFSLWPSFWTGLVAKQTYADDKMNSELSTTSHYEVSFGRQMDRMAMELGSAIDVGRFHSDSGQGSLSARSTFIRAGWGRTIGLRLLGKLAFKTSHSDNSTRIVDKGQSWNVDFGLTWIR